MVYRAENKQSSTPSRRVYQTDTQSTKTEKPHWVDHFAIRCAILYPETWAVQNKQLMQAMKYEYVTTRGLEATTLDEIDTALNLWKSQNQFPPKPNQLVEYVKLAKEEIQQRIDKEQAKHRIAPPDTHQYLDPKRQQELQIKISEFRKKYPNATPLDVCRAALAGRFK